MFSDEQFYPSIFIFVIELQVDYKPPNTKWLGSFDGKCLPRAYIYTFSKSMDILPSVENMCTWVKTMKLLIKIFFT
jgi:hypothetical protein